MAVAATAPDILGHKIADMMLTAGELDDFRRSLQESGSQIVVERSDTGIVSLRAQGSHAPQWKTAVEDFYKSARQINLLLNTALMSLVSSCEWFFSNLQHQYYATHPSAISSKDKSLSLDDLKGFDSIEDARNHLIETRIEGVVRGPFDEWIRVLREAPFKLSLGYLDPVLPALIEVFQRRNLFVHNGGVVNSIFLRKVAPELRREISAGDVLTNTREYLDRAIDLLQAHFSLIAAEMWKQFAPKDENRAELLTALVLESLKKNRWRVAEPLSDFLTRDRQLTEASTTVARVNHWQTLKWQGRYEEIRNDVENVDFSAKDAIYRLALLAIKSDVTGFFELLPVVLASGRVTAHDLEDWPIFREVRSDERFQTAVLELKAKQATTIQPSPLRPE